MKKQIRSEEIYVSKETDDVMLNEKRAPVTAPLLVAAVLLLMRISELILPGALERGTNRYLVFIVIQIIVYVLPCIFYYYTLGRKLSSPVFVGFIKPSHLIFTVFTALMFICGNLLIKFLMYYGAGGTLGGGTGAIAGYSIPTADVNSVYIFLTFAVIPAVCEELFFRGVILSEYRAYGSVNSIVISALCFSMAHFSYENFFVYFFSGIVFGFAAAVTRSIYTPILLHLINNALNLYVDDSFLKLMMQESGSFFVSFVLILGFTMSLLAVLIRTETIYHNYSKKPPVKELPPDSKSNFYTVFMSPAFLALLAIFIVTTALANYGWG